MDYAKIEQNIKTLEEAGVIMTTTTTSELFEVKETIEELFEVKETIEEEGENNPVINDFLNSDYGSYEEQEFKKMMAAAAIISGSEAAPEEIASQADASATSIKTAYKVATGQLDVTRSWEIMIDRAAARLITILQENIKMEWVGDRIVHIIAYAYHPAEQLRPYVRAVMRKIEPKVHSAIEVGVKTIATTLKETVRTWAGKIANKIPLLAK